MRRGRLNYRGAMRTMDCPCGSGELVFDLHNDEQHLIPEIQKLMEEAIPLSVPLTVDCGVGENWLEAH